jgi:preprotein translocase subunit SecF
MNLFAGNYKLYLIAPALAVIAFFFLIFVFPGLTQGIDLRGGTNIIIRSDQPLDADQLKETLQGKFALQDLKVITIGSGTIIEFAHHDLIFKAQAELDSARGLLASDPAQAKALALQAVDSVKPLAPKTPPANLDAESMVEFARVTLVDAKEAFQKDLQQTIVQEFNLGDEVKFQKKEVGAKLGANFWDSAVKVSLIALVLIIIVIFIFFREIIPSLAVIAAALFDMLGAMAGMALFGIPFGIASIPALLMLIGYSVDTDIMLTTRLLKRREGTPVERTLESMKTGLTMTLTTLAAITVMMLLAYFNQLLIVFEISAVIFFGLIADLISTWLMNAPVLLWFTEKKAKKVTY